MSHVRTQIRDAVALALAPVGTVLKSRTWPVAEAALPVILLYTNAEVVDVEESGFDVYDRALSVVVEPVVQDTGDTDTVLDTLIAAIETALGSELAPPSTLNALTLHCLLRGLEVIVSVEGAQPIARARLTYEARYRTSFTDPTIAI